MHLTLSLNHSHWMSRSSFRRAGACYFLFSCKCFRIFNSATTKKRWTYIGRTSALHWIPSMERLWMQIQWNQLHLKWVCLTIVMGLTEVIYLNISIWIISIIRTSWQSVWLHVQTSKVLQFSNLFSICLIYRKTNTVYLSIKIITLEFNQFSYQAKIRRNDFDVIYVNCTNKRVSWVWNRNDLQSNRMISNNWLKKIR